MRRFIALLIALLAVTAFLALAPAARAAWVWPVSGDVITEYRNGTDPYATGQHRGIDISAPVGTPVVAAAGGEVRFAGTAGSSGLTIGIRTGDGYDTSYLHLSSLTVRAGAYVSAGERIGAVGTTGVRSAEAPHLHFGVRDAGTRHDYHDPLAFLPPPPPAPHPPPPAPATAPQPVPPAAAPVTVPRAAPRPHAVPHARPHAVPHGRPYAVPHARPHTVPHGRPLPRPRQVPNASPLLRPHATPRATPAPRAVPASWRAPHGPPDRRSASRGATEPATAPHSLSTARQTSHTEWSADPTWTGLPPAPPCCSPAASSAFEATAVPGLRGASAPCCARSSSDGEGQARHPAHRGRRLAPDSNSRESSAVQASREVWARYDRP
jgi:hypothetical protein